MFSGIYYGTCGQVLSRKSDSVIISCGGHTAIEVRWLLVDDVKTPAPKVFTSIKDRLSSIANV